MTMAIRRLGPDDAAAFQALRLQGLLECPSAFASSHAEEVTLPLATVAERLGGDGPLGVYGAFDAAGRLLGVAGLGRESMTRLAHKAVLWGMYVEPGSRRQGLARRLVAELLAQARGLQGVRQVTLGARGGQHGRPCALHVARFRGLGHRARGHLGRWPGLR